MKKNQLNNVLRSLSEFENPKIVLTKCNISYDISDDWWDDED